jgi:hypothetical protein
LFAVSRPTRAALVATKMAVSISGDEIAVID